ncbi:DNA double-strand break repair nuclease NurA [Sulfuracidifex tepidarius]|uniref:NurA domain-containing protein n=1 Tax=Sulfuracidifex tepidarius TaxID=1294262 RepID=A0A510DZX5_9CREN|nr:DNA double-strand break repair nuclease NurA [Sulfuracidifex tepidarius]BBG25795.1 hypothetical protein IC007_0300 [Sulfuracidifex tepidarius]
MGLEDVIEKLMKALAEASKDEPYLGVMQKVDIVDSTPVYEDGELGECEPLNEFAYLDTSSRVIQVKGANIYMASLYGNDNGIHVMVPSDSLVPFIAVKGSKKALEKVKAALGDLLVTENVNGVEYDLEYKDDNILDELRISLENHFIETSKNVVVVDGPVVPGPYLEMVGEPYRSAFEELASRRRREKLVGVVKRLSFTRKLSREEKVGSKFPRLLGSTDDVIVHEMSKSVKSDVFFTPVYKEELNLKGGKVTRYMVYVKVRDSVFRVESTDRELLCRGVFTSARNASIRGIPTFIEVADKMSKRLSASTFVLSFVYAKTMLGVNYEDWNSFVEAKRDLNE